MRFISNMIDFSTFLILMFIFGMMMRSGIKWIVGYYQSNSELRGNDMLKGLIIRGSTVLLMELAIIIPARMMLDSIKL